MVKTLTHIEFASGQVLSVVGVEASATDVAESESGTLALGTGTGSVGAVDLRQTSNAALLGTIPVSGPVVRIAASQGGDRFFSLQESDGQASVDIIAVRTRSVVASIAVPAGTIDVTPTADGSGFWVLLPGGIVEQFASNSPRPLTMFGTGQTGSALALSPDGQTLYVLRSSATRANVAVVRLATQSVRVVLPAPAASVDIVVSLDGSRFYAAASPAGSSNVQAFNLPG